MFHLVSFYVHFIMQYHFIILMLFAFNPLQSKMQKTETDFQQMIQARIRKFEEIEASVKLSKVCVLFECFFFIINNYLTETYMSCMLLYLYMLSQFPFQSAQTL